MADLKISEMTPAAELTGAELIECVQGGVNVKQELTGLKTWVNNGKPKVLGYGTSLETLEVGYEYVNPNDVNLSSVVYEMPDPEFVPDGSRVVIHNLKFGGTTLLGTSNWTQGGPSRFMEFPNYSPATTSPIPEYSRGVITTLTSIKAYKVWLKESHRPSKMLPTGDSMRFYREDDITATITNYLGNIPAATNRVITYPDSDVDLGKLTTTPTYTASTGVLAFPKLDGTAATSLSMGNVSDSAFRIQDNGDATKQIAFEASGIATATTRTITMPDADINFGNLSFVATINNVLGGTDCRIEGGTDNNVSGTGCATVNCFHTTLSGTRNTAINCGESGSAFIGSGTENTFINCRGTTQGSGSAHCTYENLWNIDPILNSKTYPDGTKITGLAGAGISTDCSLIGLHTTLPVQLLSNTLAPWSFLTLASGFESAFHDIEIVGQTLSGTAGSGFDGVIARRRVTVLKNNRAAGVTFDVQTVGTDIAVNAATYTITITEASFLLSIVCQMTSTTSSTRWQARVRSTYL